MKAGAQIAVVGAGPAGLAAALYLHRSGHRCTVFERFDRPSPVGSGLILQPTGLTVLADLGLLGSILALGSRIDRLHGRDARSGRTVLDVRYGDRPGGGFGLAVHRAALFSVLHDAVFKAGITVETGAEIADLSVAETAVPITAGAKRLGGFDLVVDASGARSQLRRHVKYPAEPRPLAYGAFWASLAWRGEGFDASALLQRYERASVMIGVLPIGRPALAAEPMAALFWSLRPGDAEAVRAAGLEAWKQRLRGLWPDCEAYLAQIESFEQMTLARYGHHTLKEPAGRRLAVIGDAAHSASPQLGQGANMALLDAAALCHALGQANDVADALDIYTRARRTHVSLFQLLSFLFTPFYQSDSRLLPVIRDRLVATVARMPPAPRLLAEMVCGTLVDPFAWAGLVEADWATLSGAAKPPCIAAGSGA